MRRQSLIRLQHAHSLLSDRYGTWCAWCLGYIDSPADLELHHMLAPRLEIKKEYGIEPWVVPVHGHPDRCHRKGLQDYANYAGRVLLDLRDPSALDSHATDFFYDGYLPASLLLRKWAWNESMPTAGAREQLRYTLIAAAGTRRGLAYLSTPKASSDLQLAEPDTELLVYLTAAQANSGDVKHARRVFHELDVAKPRVRAATSSINSKLSRVRATIFPDLISARQAVQISRDSSDAHYQTLTALLTLSSAYEASHRFRSALDLGLQIEEDNDRPRLSWWHKIQIQGLVGRATLLASSQSLVRRDRREAMKRLLRAQYAAAMLDFAGLPVPEFRQTSLGGTVARVTPTDAVHWFSYLMEFSKEEMLEMRREAILGERCGSAVYEWPLGLQRELIDSIVGKSTL